MGDLVGGLVVLDLGLLGGRHGGLELLAGELVGKRGLLGIGGGSRRLLLGALLGGGGLPASLLVGLAGGAIALGLRSGQTQRIVAIGAQGLAAGDGLLLEDAELLLPDQGIGGLGGIDLPVLEPQPLGAGAGRDDAGGLAVPVDVGAAQADVGVHCAAVVLGGAGLQRLGDHAHHGLDVQRGQLELGALEQQPRGDLAAHAGGVVGPDPRDGLRGQGEATSQPVLAGDLIGDQLLDIAARAGLAGLHRGGDDLRREVPELLPGPDPRAAAGGVGAQQVGAQRDRRVGLQGERGCREVDVPLDALAQFGQAGLVLGRDEDRIVDQLLQ